MRDVFERYEKKYLLTRAQYSALSEALRPIAEVDQYGKHTISNIYYDTDDYRLIRASIAKPVYKEKLRLRAYGKPTAEGEAFVELKKKFKGVVYKRRAVMTLAEAESYLSGASEAPRESQITREIDWFRRFYEDLSPKAYIAYDRVALAGKEDPELRLTFDENIRFRADRLRLADGQDGQLILPKELVLMELKISRAMSVWMSQLLSELEIYPASFSKYGVAYNEFILTDGERVSKSA